MRPPSPFCHAQDAGKSLLAAQNKEQKLTEI
jgi:hypothetical protein